MMTQGRLRYNLFCGLSQFLYTVHAIFREVDHYFFPTMKRFCRFGTTFIQRAGSKVRTPTIFKPTRLFLIHLFRRESAIPDVHAKAVAELVEKVDYEHYMLSIFFPTEKRLLYQTIRAYNAEISTIRDAVRVTKTPRKCVFLLEGCT